MFPIGYRTVLNFRAQLTTNQDYLANRTITCSSGTLNWLFRSPERLPKPYTHPLHSNLAVLESLLYTSAAAIFLPPNPLCLQRCWQISSLQLILCLLQIFFTGHNLSSIRHGAPSYSIANHYYSLCEICGSVNEIYMYRKRWRDKWLCSLLLNVFRWRWERQESRGEESLPALAVNFRPKNIASSRLAAPGSARMDNNLLVWLSQRSMK